MSRRKVVLMGAAGRDFHNFNCLFRYDGRYEVVAFTAAQIPGIGGRTYPEELAGPFYPKGIPIHGEEELEEIVRGHGVDEVWFCYSDVSHADLMHKASQVAAWGASFGVCSAQRTMLTSTRPVIAVTAVRTGVGKSQTTRYLGNILRHLGMRVVAVRHPMPYGDLAAQAVQRFASYDDLARQHCTIEEREEYEPLIEAGFTVFAGVDYDRILRAAETEADVILWDGGNNDTPFLRPNLHITLVDPHRPGDEIAYYPGEINLRLADVVLVNKVNTADPEDVELVIANCRRINPRARLLKTQSLIRIDDPAKVRGRRALVVEDGPTVTHGGMRRGAGWYAALQSGAAVIVDPAPYAVGSLRETYRQYPNARGVLPAMGYGEQQIRDLEATIEATPADVVVEGTPIELRRVLRTEKPIADVHYELAEATPGVLAAEVRSMLERLGVHARVHGEARELLPLSA